MEIQKVLTHRNALHTYFWVVIFFLLFLANNQEHFSTFESIKNTLLLIIPCTIPVYINLYLLNRLFHRRKYVLYIFSIILIFIVSGYLINLFYDHFKSTTTDSNSYVGLIILLLLSSGGRYFSRGLYQQYRIQETEAKNAQAEIALLKAQINPHFLFNTLNNLYALTLIKSDKVPQVVLKLSGLMRYLLETSKKDWVELKDEWNYIEDYIELEKLRLNIPHKITTKVEGSITGKKIAPLLLLPLVENIFKHGVNSSSKSFNAQVLITLTNDSLTLAITNDKPINKNIYKTSTGLGHKNLKQRLNLHYRDCHVFGISETTDKYSVRLEITNTKA